MLQIEQKNDGTIDVWHCDTKNNLSVRVCTRPYKLATTLPRDELVLVRKLVNELDRLLPEEPVPTQTVNPRDTASVDVDSLTDHESSPAAD